MSVTIKALWHIESHLSGDLSLDAIADATGVSRFHLSRAFGAGLGIPLGAYIRGRRLSEAAKELANGAPEIVAVALNAGYGSHEAFTRAFRQQFGVTPEQLRAEGQIEKLSLLEATRMDRAATTSVSAPRIVQRDAMLVFGLGQRYHCHSKAGIPSQWDRFLPHLGHIPGQVGPLAYGVVCNTDDSGNFEYICGVEVAEFPNHPAEFARLRIPAQTYAVFEHREHISAIHATMNAIWNEALPASGLKAADGPMFEQYGEEFDGRTGLGGLEIWIPVKE